MVVLLLNGSAGGEIYSRLCGLWVVRNRELREVRKQSSGEGQRCRLWLLCVKLKKCGMCEEEQRPEAQEKDWKSRGIELNWGSFAFGALCGLVAFQLSGLSFVHCVLLALDNGLKLGLVWLLNEIYIFNGCLESSQPCVTCCVVLSHV